VRGVMERRVGDGEEAGWLGGVKDRGVDKWDPLIC